MQPSFNTGELSPRLHGRVDLEKYLSGLATCLNFKVHPHGGVSRREGFRYIAATKDSTKTSRLFPFEYSTTQAYIIEAGDQYLRFYMDGGQVVAPDSPDAWATATDYVDGDFVTESSTTYRCIEAHTSGTFATDLAANKWVASEIYELQAPWAHTDLAYLRFAQTADLMYIVHPDYKPRKLTRTGHRSWTLTEVTFEWGPWRDINESSTTLDAGALTGTGVALVASADLFDDDQVGAYFKLQDGYVLITAVTDAQNAVCTVIEDLTAHTATADWYESAWSDYRGWPHTVTFFEERLCFGGNDSQPQTFWLSQTGDYENFNISSPLVDTDACTYTLAADQVNVIRWLKSGKRLLIGTSGGEWWATGNTDNEAISPSSILVRRETTFGSEPVDPVLVGNAVLMPQKPGTKIREFAYQDYEYVGRDLIVLSEHLFKQYVVTDMAYQQSPDQVLWVVRSDGYMVGLTYMPEHDVYGWHRHTTNGEFEAVATIPGTTQDELWAIIKRSINGSDVRYVERLEPAFIGNEVDECLWVDCGLDYEGDTMTITAIDLENPVKITGLSNPFSDDDVVQFVDVTGTTEINGNRYTVDNATATTFTLKKDETDVDGSDYGEWTLGDAWVTKTDYLKGEYVSYESASYRCLQDHTSGKFDRDLSDEFWLAVTPTAKKVVTTVSGLSHLEGETVAVLGDGGEQADATVSSASITIAPPANKIQVGLSYTSDMKTLRMVSPRGGMQGKTKRIHKLTVRVYDTIGFKIGRNPSDLEEVLFRQGDDFLGTPPSLFTGDKDKTFPPGHDTKGQVFIRQDAPLPLTVLAVIPEAEVN